MDYQPTVVDNFRGIVLFGRNVASYKFALARALIELAGQGKTRVSLSDLAVPFSAHLAAHLKEAPRQATSASSKFLDACRQYNEGTLTREGLIDATVRLGSNNVIDAFHVVAGQDVSDRFFIDERRTQGGIVLTAGLCSPTLSMGWLPRRCIRRWMRLNPDGGWLRRPGISG